MRFKDRDVFGRFCVILADDHIPFKLAGFQTIVVAKMHLDKLPKASAQFYEQCKQQNHIEDASPVVSVGTRRLPTQQETERLLKQLADEF